MDYRILGPLDVRDGDRQLVLGGARQRALLGLLLVHANEVVSSDRLVDELWGGPDGSKALQVRGLAAAQGDRSRTVLVTRPPGYELCVEPGQLDLHRFERLVSEGRAALSAGDAQAASAALTEALALWRGPPLADLSFEAFAPGGALAPRGASARGARGSPRGRARLGRHAEMSASSRR